MAEKDLNQTLLEQIECPVCFEYMCSKIYICIKGHSICAKCWDCLAKCPLCQADMSDTRNISMEAMTQILNYPCPNQEAGCKDSFRISARDDHVSICSFRKYKCIIPNTHSRTCHWVGRRLDLLNHSIVQHNLHFIIGPDLMCKWKSTTPKREVSLVSAHKELFYFHRLVKDGNIHFVVQYIGKSEDAIQFCYEISFFTDQFRHRSITISENCQDDLKTDLTEIIESGFAVTIPLQIMESYKNRINATHYKVSIKTT